MGHARLHRLLAWATASAGVLAGAADAAAMVERITVNSAEVQANWGDENIATEPVIALSADGRLVAFASAATNLVGRDRNRASDVFVRDRRRGTTVRVSVASNGEEVRGGSYDPAMSSDGRYVAFISNAASLTRRRDSAGVFLRDRRARVTDRVDVDSSGATPNGRPSGQPAVSDDGRVVAFTSEASNLAPGDADGYADVFVHDRRTGETEGIGLAAPASGYDFSVLAGMSRDGRFLLIGATAPLTLDAPRGPSSMFVHDRRANATTWIGVSNFDSFDLRRAAISDDGSVVAFERFTDPFGVVVWERASGAIRCVSCWKERRPVGSDMLSGMSADGRRIAMTRERLGRRYTSDLVVRDLRSGRTTRASIAHDGRRPNGPSWPGGLSPDGRVAAFFSHATNIVPGDTNRRQDLFVTGPL